MSDTAPSQLRRLRTWLVALIVFAAFVRLVGVNWDDGHSFHPDERRIAFAVEELSFWPLQLNPHFFAYGSFPLYVTRAVTSVLGLIYSPLGRYDSLIHSGRAISGAVGVLTVVLLFLFGTRLYNRSVGLLAGFLLAACVLHIQNSHYMTSDVFLAFLVLLALYFLVGVVQRGWTRDYVYAGIAIGLATATKFSALPLLAPLAVAALVRVYRQRQLFPVVGRGLLAVVVALLAFAASQPYALLDYAAYSHDILEQSRMVRNAGLLPYTNQYIGTPKYGYELTQLVLWGMAPLLGLVAIWATATRVVAAVRERSAVDLILLSWVVPFFLVTGWFEVKFVRYLLPIYPIMILWAAAWLWRISRTSRLGRVTLWAVVVGTGLSALAFLSIYQRPHTVVTASEWAYRHIPEGSTILSQHWDEGFPLPRLSGSPSRFKVINLPYYEPDTSAKMRQISQELANADYIALQTKRLYGSVTRAPRKYPLTNNHFYLLFAGDLGYTLIYDHASRPSLFGLEFPDELADESITVYDHPKVLIFQNTGHLSADEILERIMRGLPSRKLTRTDLLLAEAGDGGLADAAAATPPIRASWPALLWFAVVVQLLGMSAYAILYRWLPVTGCYSLAKVLGVLAFAYISWLLTSLGQTSFTRGALTGTFLLLLLCGLLARRRATERPPKEDWLPTELLFWTTFVVFLTIRAFNPEAFWGEKPMDFAFLNALTRSTTLPPPEPWFSGSLLHYTYFGHYLIASLGKLVHIHPGLTFNLGIALTAALTATAAFALGCAITSRWRIGLLAAVFVALIGNLAGLREILARQVMNFDYFWATSRVIQHTINEYPLWSFLFADLHAHVLVMPFSLTFLALAIWWVRRAEAARPIRPITLFFLLALTLGAIMVTNGWSSPTYILFFPFMLGCIQFAHSDVSRRQMITALALLVFLLLIFGVEAVYPSHSLPRFSVLGFSTERLYAYLKIVVAGAALLVFVPRAVLLTVTLVALAYLLYAPFWRHFTAPPRNWGFEVQSFANFYDYVNIFGLFLFAAIPFLFALWRRQLQPAGDPSLGWRSLPMWIVGLTTLGCLLLTLPVIEERLPHWFSLHGSLRIGLAILAVLAFHVALQRPLATPQRLTAIMLAFAFAVTAGTDIVYVWDRMNTIFKFYLESWFLFAVAAAVATVDLWRGLIRSSLLRHTWQVGFVGLIALAVFTAGSGVYAMVTTARVPTVRPTLDGTAYLLRRNPHEQAAYEWLNENIAGIPVMTEAYGPSYQDFARVSMNTGLPTVLGWDYHVHQRAHRWPDINRRKDDLKLLYTSDDEQTVAEVLKRYHVALVFVGQVERRTHNGGNLKQFETWTDLLTPVYQNAGVTVFGVNGQFTGAMPITTVEEVPEVEEERKEEARVQGTPGTLRQPRGVAVDRQGNVYVADFGNDRIQKFDPELEFVAEWGEQGGNPSEFDQPGDIAVDSSDAVYVADTWNQRVQVFSTDGEYQREFGGSFFGPRGIAVGPDGTVYLADTGNHKIQVFDSDGVETATWGSQGSDPGQFREPVGIATDADGSVYVCDNANARVQIFDTTGVVQGTFDVDGWEAKVYSEPHITVTPSGIIWVTVPLERAVRAYDRAGNLLHEIVGKEDGIGLFQRPMGVAYLPATDELVITDLEHRVIRIPVPVNAP